jgi:hypothetical protein
MKLEIFSRKKFKRNVYGDKVKIDTALEKHQNRAR